MKITTHLILTYFW